jgi:hypothetical protein
MRTGGESLLPTFICQVSSFSPLLLPMLPTLLGGQGILWHCSGWLSLPVTSSDFALELEHNFLQVLSTSNRLHH